MTHHPDHRRKRHHWGKRNATTYKTERVCRRCGLIRITDHSGPGIPFIHWDHPAAPADVTWPANTPACPPAEIERTTA